MWRSCSGKGTLRYSCLMRKTMWRNCQLRKPCGASEQPCGAAIPLGEGTHAAQVQSRDAAVKLILPCEAAVMFIQQREAAVRSI